jgi:type IX secretion system PorP/SprF family membrane protein
MSRKIKILFFCLVPATVFGQQVPVTSQYMFNPMTINPAFAGSREALNLASFYRLQWAGLKGAPETLTLSVDAPVADKKLGLGLMLVNDKIGVTNENQFITNYSYRIRMKTGILSMGIGAGIILTSSTNSQLVVNDPGDEQYLVNSRVFAVPDFSFGVQYTGKRYFAGFSIPKLLSYTFDYTRNKYVLKNDIANYSYLLNTGFMFDLSSRIRLYPSALLIYSKIDKFQFDLNAHISFYDRIWTGVSYRNGRSVSLLFQIQPFSQIRIGYSYDFDISKLGNFNNGTHEFMLRFEFRYKVDVVSPLVF